MDAVKSARELAGEEDRLDPHALVAGGGEANLPVAPLGGGDEGPVEDFPRGSGGG